MDLSKYKWSWQTWNFDKQVGVQNIKDSGKYRARLVVRGCQQHKGIGYNETL